MTPFRAGLIALVLIAALGYLAWRGYQQPELILDFANAFNSISRAKVWQTLLKHDCLGGMLKAFYAQYAEPTELLVYGAIASYTRY